MGSLFGKAPKPPAPALMPDEDAIAAAKRRAITEQAQRSGRDSTILSDNEGL